MKRLNADIAPAFEMRMAKLIVWKENARCRRTRIAIFFSRLIKESCFVIPAKAGIQNTSDLQIYWIPAFAGMT
jgi:hypothetical protein